MAGAESGNGTAGIRGVQDSYHMGVSAAKVFRCLSFYLS